MARHPATEEKMSHLSYKHLPLDLQEPSRIVANAATEILNEIPGDSSQLTLGLQHLIDAKDCFVRAKVAQLNDDNIRNESTMGGSTEGSGHN